MHSTAILFQFSFTSSFSYSFPIQILKAKQFKRKNKENLLKFNKNYPRDKLTKPLHISVCESQLESLL